MVYKKRCDFVAFKSNKIDVREREAVKQRIAINITLANL